MLQKNGTFLLLVLLLLALHEYEPIKYKEVVVSVVEETRKYILKMFSLIKVLCLFINSPPPKKKKEWNKPKTHLLYFILTQTFLSF